MVFAALNRLRIWYWRRCYRPGKVLTRFIACDVRRDVELVDASHIETGIITVRTRTWNLLYVAKGIKEKPEFGDVRKIAISELWKWSGEPWGGPVPDATGKAA